MSEPRRRGHARRAANRSCGAGRAHVARRWRVVRGRPGRRAGEPRVDRLPARAHPLRRRARSRRRFRHAAGADRAAPARHRLVRVDAARARAPLPAAWRRRRPDHRRLRPLAGRAPGRRRVLRRARHSRFSPASTTPDGSPSSRNRRRPNAAELVSRARLGSGAMRRDFPELPLTERNRLAFRWIPKGTPALLDAGCAWGSGHASSVNARTASPASTSTRRRSRSPPSATRGSTLRRLRSRLFRMRIRPWMQWSVFDVLEPRADQHKSLNELCRVLRPGGMLILTTSAPGPGSPFMGSRRNVLRRLGRSDEPEHRHYSVGDLRRLLDASRWAGNYEIVRVQRSGFLLFPLALWLAAIPRATSVVRKLVDIAIEIDSFLRWGPLAYSVALKVRKLPASALADQGRGIVVA